MQRSISFILSVGMLMVFAACDKSDRDHQTSLPKEDRLATETAAQHIPLDHYQSIDWTALMPEDDLDALLNPPSFIDEIEDGSVDDQISSSLSSSLTDAIAAANDDRYQQALVSRRVIDAMDGQAVRVPGFIVPLEFNEEQLTTQFFLVPYFGACIHMPPPPNQIIYVEYPPGLKLASLYDPFWISGVLKTAIIENDMATAAYTMTMHTFELYTD